MRNIGIMTFHASHNCGSMLQAFALQRFLKTRLNESSEIINYSNENQQRIYSVLYRPKSIKQVLRNLLNLFFFKRLKKHFTDYNEFLAKNCILTKQSYSKISQLKEVSNSFSHVITGSDQVWNINAADCDYAYYLSEFSNCKKIAYAVSLGATNISEHPKKNELKKLINEFSHISVREQNAQKWVQNLYNQGDVNICADPTLLLDSEEWENLVGTREVQGKYIFWYAMTYKKEMQNIVLNISKQTGLPVYVIDAKEWSRRGLFLRGIKVAKNGGPSSFLSLIKNAELVLTSSFHGSIFSSIFRKNFWYLNLRDHVTQDDRSSFLLKQLGLENRFLMKSEILKQDLTKPIDYCGKFNINDLLAKSRNFLSEALR